MSKRVSRRGLLRSAGLAAAAAGTARWAFGAPLAAPRPNILFIMADDHASHALSCYGSRINRTPNLDRLAREGIRFDNCFCTNSICAPSRAVILTGKYSHLNGVRDNSTTFDGTQQTFPKLLQAAGYQTAMIGKWHLKSEPTGFDYWDVLPGQGAYHNPAMIRLGERSRHEGYVTDIITDLTIDWLRTQRDPSRPFMLMCHHKAPHRNWQPDAGHQGMYADIEIPEPETFDDDYRTRSDAARQQKMSVLHDLTATDLKRVDPPEGLTQAELKSWKYQRYIKDYLRCIASVDDNVGRLLGYLDETSLVDNTLVVYTSDQGFYLGDHGWFDKRFMYEESLRMPLLMRCPGMIRAGAASDALVTNVDFAPTFLDVAGAGEPTDMQGRSFVPILRGRKPSDWRQAVYYHYYEYPAVHSVKRHYGIRTERYKLLHFYYDIDAWELYDLESDPHELNNVYDDPAHAATVAMLKKQLQRLQEQYGDDSFKELIGQPHPDFERVAFARVTDSEMGYDISSAQRGYALRRTPRTYTQNATLRCGLKTLRADGTRNGLICLGPNANPQSMLKCGVYIGAGEMVILYGEFGGPEADIVRKPIQADKGKVFDLRVDVDLLQGAVKLTVDREELTAPLRMDWDRIGYIGYNVSYTATAFTGIDCEGR